MDEEEAQSDQDQDYPPPSLSVAATRLKLHEGCAMGNRIHQKRRTARTPGISEGRNQSSLVSSSQDKSRRDERQSRDLT